ncbi:hypothetical protein BDR22DRAFT_348066 [Usnea florida]
MASEDTMTTRPSTARMLGTRASDMFKSFHRQWSVLVVGTSKPLPFFPCRCCSSPCSSLTQPIAADFALPPMRHEYPGVGEVEYLAIYHYKYLTFLLRLGYLSPNPRHTWSECLGNLVLLTTRVLPQVHGISRQACLPDRDHHLHLVHLGLRPLRPQ